MHSSATGRSAVPAVSTSTRPVRSGAGRQVEGGQPAACRRSTAPVARRPAPLAAAAWSGSARVSRTGPPGSSEQLDHYPGALLGGLPGAVDGLGQPLAQRPVMIDPGEAEVGEGQPPQAAHGVVGRACARGHVVEQLAELRLVHQAHYPAPV